ncbi:inner centromere protein isoform X2 [Hypomesus transpacificus]|uniref:inner centromere protein isoform X2 n=1 Tax=Hypomesus transpacificus TaxID=137520 RepID=UPI001F076E89|nr:inner centromere protein isoform X2 [Hypomesus transpacificus]
MSCSVFSSTQALMQLFDGKVQEFISDIENVHMVWLVEIQQEANRMFSSDFSAEPELMPKTPSQKKSNRRKRVSLGRAEKTAKRRFSKGKRSNLRRSSVSTLNLIAEDDANPEAATSEVFEEPKRSTRRNKQGLKQQSEEAEDVELLSGISRTPPKSLSDRPPERAPKEEIYVQIPVNNTHKETETGKEFSSLHTTSPHHSPASLQLPDAVVKLTAADRRSADLLVQAAPSPGRSATKMAIATTSSSRRSSVRHSLTLRRSLAGLRHSMTQESVRQASRRSFLKKKARMGSSTCSSNVSEDVIMSDVVENTKGVESEEATTAEEQTKATDTETSPEVQDMKLLPQSESDGIRFTRSMAQNTPSMVSTIPIITKDKSSTPYSGSDGGWKKNQSHSILRSRPSSKRRGTDASGDFQSPKKKPSPPKKSQTAIRPNMRSFLHTVQKNQMLMMTPSSVGRGSVMKSFINHATPLKVDAKERERLKLEAVKKKQEQEEERKRKMEEEKKRKREEMKRKRDERLRKVVEARVKEEQKEEEKKKKIEQKMAQIDEKNDKLRVERLAEEKAKKKVATKRQEELEQRRRLEEETRRKKIQQAEEEERRLQDQQARRRAEEEQERARKLAEARRAHELKKEQEREKELEREKLAAAEKERAEWEKALALQREAEKSAKEKEKRVLEEKKKELEEQKKRVEQARLAEEERAAKQREAVKPEHAVMTPVGKGLPLNQTLDIEQSPQSYEITPKGGNKPLVISYNPENYGMDQNSDDSTDDESAPRKPIPSWAEGLSLKQSMMKQYFNPLNLHSYFGVIEEPRLENIFDKSKPRFFKRTSSAVWNSPPRMGTLPH